MVMPAPVRRDVPAAPAARTAPRLRAARRMHAPDPAVAGRPRGCGDRIRDPGDGDRAATATGRARRRTAAPTTTGARARPATAPPPPRAGAPRPPRPRPPRRATTAATPPPTTDRRRPRRTAGAQRPRQPAPRPAPPQADQRAPRATADATPVVGLTERRIGLLFAIFLGLLVIAGGRDAVARRRAGAVAAARGGTQQVDEIDVPARRGAISDRNGVELAVAEPAADVAATPYLVKQPAKVAMQLAPLLGQTQSGVLEKLGASGGFVYLARNLPAAKAEKIKKLEIAGLQFIPSARRDYPRRWLASQLLGGIGIDGNGLTRPRVHVRPACCTARDGTRRIVKDALGSRSSCRRPSASMPGKDLKLTLDAQLQSKVEDVLAQIGAKWHPKGATAVVMDPGPSTILALADWPRVDANDLGGAPSYATQNRAVRLHLRAGLDVQAVHRRRRARGPQGRHAGGVLAPAAVDPGRRPRDRGVAPARPDRPHDGADPRAVLERRHGPHRAAPRRGPLRLLGAALRLRQADEASSCPARRPASCCRASKYTGPSMGNLPIGQGESVTPIQLATAYAAIANGGVLRRPRIVARIGDRAKPVAAGRRVISERTAATLRTMLSGVLAAGGTASSIAIPGYTLAGKTGTANKIDADTGEYSKSRYIALVRRLRPGAQPEAARHRHGRRAAGRDLRRRGRGAGVRGDHALRAAVPADRAGLSTVAVPDYPPRIDPATEASQFPDRHLADRALRRARRHVVRRHQAPPRSVGNRELKRDAVTASKIRNGSIGPQELTARRRRRRGPRGPQGPSGSTGSSGAPGSPASSPRRSRGERCRTPARRRLRAGQRHTAGAFRKDPFGSVDLRGLVTKNPGTPSQGDVIALLPAGYRPPARMAFPVATGSATDVYGRVDVQADGAVVWIAGGTGETDFTSLGTVSFWTDPEVAVVRASASSAAAGTAAVRRRLDELRVGVRDRRLQGRPARHRSCARPRDEERRRPGGERRHRDPAEATVPRRGRSSSSGPAGRAKPRRRPAERQRRLDGGRRRREGLHEPRLDQLLDRLTERPRDAVVAPCAPLSCPHETSGLLERHLVARAVHRARRHVVRGHQAARELRRQPRAQARRRDRHEDPRRVGRGEGPGVHRSAPRASGVPRDRAGGRFDRYGSGGRRRA